MSVGESQPRKRGGCLTVFLVVVLVANLWGGFSTLFAGSTARDGFPPGLARMAGLLSLANCVFVVGIWKWKRWGVYGFVASVLVAAAINMVGFGVLEALPAGEPLAFVLLIKAFQIALSLSGLVGLVILLVLIRPVWAQME